MKAGFIFTCKKCGITFKILIDEYSKEYECNGNYDYCDKCEKEKQEGFICKMKEVL